MRLNFFASGKTLSQQEAKKLLINALQNAHAGEKAAANAYWGHGNSLFVRDKKEKLEIFNIYKDELHHRARLAKMLQVLNARPRFLRETLMYMVGAVIATLCLFGGWFIPMYGAGKLESTNIEEYEVAARLAYLATEEHLIEELLIFAEIEWDHELYFRKKAKGHRLFSLFPQWQVPPPRDNIRHSFAEFTSSFALKRG